MLLPGAGLILKNISVWFLEIIVSIVLSELHWEPDNWTTESRQEVTL